MPERKISHRSLAMRIEALRHRHRELDTRVTQEQSRLRPDPSLIKMLKRERLRLKDAIHATQSLLARTVGRRPQGVL